MGRPFFVHYIILRRNCHGQKCKVTFGAEPKDYEIYDFILKNYYRLHFSPAVATDVKEAARNPKRKQREAEKERQFELKQQKRKKKHRGR